MIDEKHIVVYKRDRLLEEEALKYQNQVNARKLESQLQSGQVKEVRPRLVVDSRNVVQVNGKRDRRSASDVMKETELKKKSKPSS
mmetsp:Transcript_32134/g.41316  ORF Transcript_32134/g.41316 Transcript_32134/m.41316 type:complete len:85 (+) Transcript_32134:127-381(+)